MDAVRTGIRAFLGLTDETVLPVLETLAEDREEGFTRKTVAYEADGELVEAFLFLPDRPGQRGAVVLHQHNSQWHLGKSEVAGLRGDPWQALGPALARAGITVLAPDGVGFESRRGNSAAGDTLALAPPIDPSRGSSVADWVQYYNHAMHRLVRGELLIRKVLQDVAKAVTVLQRLAATKGVGVVGHSYGGNIALFAAALDPRVSYCVCSGAACSYRHKLAQGTPLEMALVIPGFASRYDLDDLIRCVAPRSLLVVSAEDDPVSADAAELVARSRDAFAAQQAAERLRHLHTPGTHALDQQRFEAIVEWVVGRPSS